MSGLAHDESRELSLREEAALLWVLSEVASSDPEGAAALHGQVGAARVVGGAATMLELRVPADAAGASVPDGPLPVRAVSVDASGGPIGEVVVWVQGGRLTALEHAWYTDEPPDHFPRPSELRTG